MALTSENDIHVVVQPSGLNSGGSRSYMTPINSKASSWAGGFLQLVTFFPPLLFLAVVLLQPWAEPKWMFLDPLVSAEESGQCCHVYFGFVSTAGVMLWTATAAVCLFCSLVFLFWSARAEITRFALTAGLLSAVFALDDAFMVHEIVMPALGVPQKLVLAAYGVFAAGYLLTNRRFLMKTQRTLLLLSGLMLSLSVSVDVVFQSVEETIVYIEDGAKFFGIYLWMVFHLLTLANGFVQPERSN